jgi:hypothetical protein
MDAKLMCHAGAKMANTMYNLAQQEGKVLDAKLIALFAEMRLEWDTAVCTPSSAPTAGRQSIANDPEFIVLLKRLISAEQRVDGERCQRLIAHIDTWAGRSAENMVVAKQPEIDAKTAETRMDSGFDGGGKIARSAGDAVPFGYFVVESADMPYPGSGFVKQPVEGIKYASVTPLYAAPAPGNTALPAKAYITERAAELIRTGCSTVAQMSAAPTEAETVVVHVAPAPGKEE